MAADPEDSEQFPYGPGEWVEVRGMSRVGQIVEVDAARKEARINIRGVDWTVALDQLTRRDPPDGIDTPPGPVIEVHTAPAEYGEEIDLHGMRVLDALDELDKFLDSAVVSRLERVKVIHGRGQGKLREAVRWYLESHPSVRDFHFGDPVHGGVGVTMVVLNSTATPSD